MMQGKTNTFIGPHEGRELELMLKGAKPLSMFVEVVPAEFECFPERDFDAMVSKGRLVKSVAIETITTPKGNEGKVRRVLYALPSDAWRIEALLLVQDLYSSLGGGWRPDLDRVIGLLLGYDREDIEKFVSRHEAESRTPRQGN